VHPLKNLWPVEEKPCSVPASIHGLHTVVIVAASVRCTHNPVLCLQRLNDAQVDIGTGNAVTVLVVHLQMPVRRVAFELKLWGSLFRAHAGGGGLG